jgi:tetratricopeptide (TPR) repeat protein
MSPIWATVLTLLAWLATAPVLAQSSVREYEACREGTTAAETRVFACSRIIADATQPAEVRVEAQQWRAIAYVAKGDRGRALADLDETIGLSADRSEAYLLRGLLGIVENNHDRAVQDLTKVVSEADRRPDVALFRSLMEIAATSDPTLAALSRGRAVWLRKGMYLTPLGQSLHNMRFSSSLRAVALFVRGASYAARGDDLKANRDLSDALSHERSEEAKKVIKDFMRQVTKPRS